MNENNNTRPDPFRLTPMSPFDALNLPKSVKYTYDVRGNVKTRKWARGVVTTYSYDSVTAELSGITYSDKTDSVSYKTNRLGALESVVDVTGSRQFVSNPQKPWRLEAEALSTFFGSRRITRLYDAAFRGAGFRLGTASIAAADMEQSWSFSDDGRYDTVSSKLDPDSEARVFKYRFLENTPWIEYLNVIGGSYMAKKEVIRGS